MAAADPLTRDRVLDAAEDTLRRFGVAKTTVVDVARALGVSHGTVYRHFTSKAQLRDAVLERWLRRVTEPLEAVAREDGPAADRLRRWLLTLIMMKRERARRDPDLFAAYAQLSQEAREVIVAHVAEMRRQVAGILADGVARGEFADVDVSSVAAAVLAATTTFHHPAHAAQWLDSQTSDVPAAEGSKADSASFDTASVDTASVDSALLDTASFDAVWRLLLLGLTPR